LGRIAKLEAEMATKIAQVLTPEQKEEFALRNSPTASTLREQLRNFGPSEAEFRAIFRLQKRFDDEFGKKAEGPEKAQAKNALANEVRSVLDAQRFSDYQRALGARTP